METITANRAFIISDTHLGARSNSLEWLEVMLDWFYSDFIPKVKQEYKPGDILIHCGDVFDNRQSINLQVMCEGIKLFEELGKIFESGIFIIAGNHDVMRKTSNDISSLDCLKHIDNINIIKEPILKKIGNSTVLFMPWRTNEEEEKKCINNYYADIEYLFCHTNIRNLNFDNKRLVEEGLLFEDLIKFKKVYSGHIHWKQNRGNITMLGNPYQMTRSDANNSKGWYLIDFVQDSEKFIENEHSPKFIRIYLNKVLEKTINELIEICKNNRVDLYIPSKYILKYKNTLLIEILSEVVKKLDIIPFEEDTTQNEDDSEAHSIENETFNVQSLCLKYVNNLTSIDNSTKEKVLNKINNLYDNTLKDQRGQ